MAKDVDAKGRALAGFSPRERDFGLVADVEGVVRRSATERPVIDRGLVAGCC